MRAPPRSPRGARPVSADSFVLSTMSANSSARVSLIRAGWTSSPSGESDARSWRERRRLKAESPAGAVGRYAVTGLVQDRSRVRRRTGTGLASLTLGRLPELDLVSLRVHDPAELSELGVVG